MKIGQKVTLNKDIADKDFDYNLLAGDTGTISNIVEYSEKDGSLKTIIIFTPDKFPTDGNGNPIIKLYAIDKSSVS